MGTKPGVSRKLRHYSSEELRRMVEALAKSRLALSRFARRWGVNPNTLSGWVCQAVRHGAGGLEERPLASGRITAHRVLRDGRGVGGVIFRIIGSTLAHPHASARAGTGDGDQGGGGSRVPCGHDVGAGPRRGQGS